MGLRERIALAWPPLVLRFGLALVFIWAGLGKVLEFTTLSGTEASTLAAMGVTVPGTTLPTPPAAPPSKSDAPKPAGPDSPLPAPEPAPGAPDKPADKPAEKPADKPEGSAKGRTNSGKRPNPAVPDAGAGSGSKTASPAPTTSRGVIRTAHADLPGELGSPPAAARTQDAPAAGNQPSNPGTPAKTSPDGSRVRVVYRLALMLHGASKPGTSESGKPTIALWPAQLSAGNYPVYLAWAVTLTELVGGFFVLLGVLTRLSALGIASVMGGAIWLTQIGPAVQSGKALLGFLPTHGAFDPAWMPLQFQVALLCMSVALLFAGPGVAALDNVLFGGGDGGPKKKPAAAPPAAPKPG